MARCLLPIVSVLVFTGCVPETAFVADAQSPEPLPKAGFSAPSLASFDEKMVAIMTRWRLPGGQLAIAKDGRLVLNRAYGYADRERREPVRTDSLFRVGSVSKTITTVAILTLVDAGRLRLDEKVFEILADLKPPKGATMDPRLRLITIQQLLQHQGGWADHDALELPWSRMAAATLGQSDPPACETIIRYAISRPLDFDPGTRSSYSNFGFCVLGRIIERRASTNRRIRYEDYVRDAVLKPSGITRMRIGGTRPSERRTGEVRYYAPAGQPLAPSVYVGEGYVPFAYGGFYLRASDAAGGWIGSAEDLVRFATAIDGQRGRALLKPETFRRMLETPVPSSAASNQPGRTQPLTGLCWNVVRRTNGFDFWHTGALKDSNAAWLVRTSAGITLAFTFNSLPADYSAFFGEILPKMLDDIQAVKTWPNVDLIESR